MKKLFFYPMLLLASFLTLTTCFDSESEGIKSSEEIILKTTAFETYLHLEFVDAKTNESLRGKDVTLVVKGKDAESVYNNLGVQESAYTTKAGFYDLMIDQNKATGDFVVNIATEGYENYVYHIRLQNTKFNMFQAKLIKSNNLPDGISVAEQKTFTTNAEGKTTADVNIQVDNSNSIRIPQNVVLKDAEGNALTGTITASVSFYDPRKTIDFFPGGLNVEAIRINSEQSTNITFVSAGLFNIELKAGNTPVKFIEGAGIELTTLIDSELVNPNTGNPVTEGDEIQLWSMDSESAVWKEEKTTSVKKNGSGQLYLSESINHLSYWNWDWFYGDYCSEGLTINFGGNAEGEIIKVINRNPLNTYSQEAYVRVDVNDPYYNHLTFMYVPRNVPVTLSFESTSPYITILPPNYPIPDMCAARPNPQITVIDTRASYTVNIDVETRSKSNPNTQVKFNGWAYVYFNSASSAWPIEESKLTVNNVRTGDNYFFDIALGKAFGYGYARVEDVSGNSNQLKLSYSPEFAYYYIDPEHYENSIQNGFFVRDTIIAKPANKIINLSLRFDLDEDLVNGLR
jgi:hypothetical protein